MTDKIEVFITNGNEVFNPEAFVRFRGHSEKNTVTSNSIAQKGTSLSSLARAKPTTFPQIISKAKEFDESYIICNKAAKEICHHYLDNIKISGLQVSYTESNDYPE